MRQYFTNKATPGAIFNIQKLPLKKQPVLHRNELGIDTHISKLFSESTLRMSGANKEIYYWTVSSEAVVISYIISYPYGAYFHRAALDT